MSDEDGDVCMWPIGDEEEEEEGENSTFYQFENRQVALQQYDDSIIVRLIVHYKVYCDAIITIFLKVHAAPLIKAICQFRDECGGSLTENPQNVDMLLQRWPSNALLDRLPQFVRRDEINLLLSIVLDAELSEKPPLTGVQTQHYLFMQYLFIFLSNFQTKMEIIKRCEKSIKRYTVFEQKLYRYAQRLTEIPIAITSAWDAEHENILAVACAIF